MLGFIRRYHGFVPDFCLTKGFHWRIQRAVTLYLLEGLSICIVKQEEIANLEMTNACTITWAAI